MAKRLIEKVLQVVPIARLVKGSEKGDPTPVAPPTSLPKAPTPAEQMRAMIRSEHLRRLAMESGNETFEEADDFEVEDDPDPGSPWEVNFDPAEHPASALSKMIEDKPTPSEVPAPAPAAAASPAGELPASPAAPPAPAPVKPA